MSWSSETTLWCDGEGCEAWIRYQNQKVTSARSSAESDAGWDCNRFRDLCQDCKE